MKTTTLYLALALSAGTAFAQEPPPRNGHRPPPPPILVIFDTDRDGVISAQEIESASTALTTLDKNGDGQITRDELRPPPPPRPEEEEDGLMEGPPPGHRPATARRRRRLPRSMPTRTAHYPPRNSSPRRKRCSNSTKTPMASCPHRNFSPTVRHRQAARVANATNRSKPGFPDFSSSIHRGRSRLHRA